MRDNGTKYKAIDHLPKGAVKVSEYAKQAGKAVGQIYLRYDRHLFGYPKTGFKSSYPGYEIRCFMGMNIVIPD